MTFDRSTRSLFAIVLATAAVILGVNLLIRADGLPDNSLVLVLVLLALAAALWAWNWRETAAENHIQDADDDADDAFDLPLVVAPALQPAAAAPAVTLTDDAEAAAEEIAVMPSIVEPEIPPVPEPVTPPAIPAEPEPVAPPAPAPAAPPAPEPVTPPAPAPEVPPVPTPVEPPVPAPVEPAPDAPVEAVAPPVDDVAPEGVTDLIAPEVKESAPEPEAPETVEAAQNGEQVAAKVVGDAMAAPEQPDPALADAAIETPPVSEPVVAAASTAPDDFTRVEGIGKYYQEALHAVGYSTFAQLAADEPDTILNKLLAAGYRRHPTIPTWPEQAGLAANGDWDGLDALQKTLIGGRRA